MNFFFGANLRPGQGHTEYLTQEGQITWGKWFVMQTAGGLFDKDTVDAGNTPTTIIRPGLALGVITASGQITQWNPYAIDGSQALYGFYAGLSQNMDLMGTATERWLGDVVVAGQVKASAVFVGGAASAGISGVTYEWLIRHAAAGRFLFDDDMGTYTAPKVYDVTGNLTVTEVMNNTHFVMGDAVAGATLTLPAPKPGLTYLFTNLSTTAGNALVLEGPATGEYWVGGAAANSISIAGDTSVPHRVTAVRSATTPTYHYVDEA